MKARPDSPAAPVAPDAAARARALDPTRSFIVQAPAGAGKTELLVQRMLTLLARVDEPTAILCITFTNKAAGEMRERIHAALKEAASSPEPCNSPARERWQLARAVVDRDRAREWNLLERPDALLIETFDAFCLRVARAGWSGHPSADADHTAWAELDPDVGELYLEAARAALDGEGRADAAEAARQLLCLLDNRAEQLVFALADLLARRGQWAPNGLLDGSIDAKKAQLDLVVGLVETSLIDLRAFWSAAAWQELWELANIACDYLPEDAPLRADLARLASVDVLGTGIDALWQWRTLACWLLTQGGDWRSRVDKNSGFPPEARQAKQRFVEQLGKFKAEDTAGSHARLLAHCLKLPDREAIERQAPVMDATRQLLALAFASLQVSLAARGVTDFAGVALAAERALREDAAAVAERLDARIQHILVDEFQDTNPAQARLLELLVAQWSQGDGRTLFAVGDPMQSIYAFRDADVGIFLTAQAHGIAGHRLEPITLTANFRARPKLIEWVNAELPRSFSSAAASATKAEVVPFVRAHAVRSSDPDACVTAAAFPSAEEEAQWVVDRITETQARDPETSIAVIVRRREDAAAVIQSLSAASVPFTAIEFARLGGRPIVRELRAVADLLARPFDCMAFATWLRSPMVGLKLATIATVLPEQGRFLTGGDRGGALQGLPEDERSRLERALRALDAARDAVDRLPLAERVWNVLVDCGGLSLVADPGQRQEAEHFLALLEASTERGLAPNAGTLGRRLDAVRQSVVTRRVAERKPVEILTMHKAKGLEWDHVFLVGLDSVTHEQGYQQVVWTMIRPTVGHSRQPQLLAAAREGRQQPGSMFRFVRELERRAHAAERARLLYVAVTRARERLYLSRADDGRPREGSLAALLSWPDSEPTGIAAADRQTDQGTAGQRWLTQCSLLRPRLASLPDQGLPAPDASGRAETRSASTAAPPDRVNEETIVGTVGHRLLETLGRSLVRVPAALWRDQVRLRREAVISLLRSEGMRGDRLDVAADRLIRHLEQLVASSDAIRFLFDSGHQAWAQELDVLVAGCRRRIDLTFMTTSGERWIVDFKFAADPRRASGDEEADRIASALPAIYGDQLRTYAAAFHGEQPQNQIRLAIYDVWRDRLLDAGLA